MGALRDRHELRAESLVEEERTVRRLATLVADGAAVEALFSVVAELVAEVLRVPLVSIVRYEDDGTATERAGFAHSGMSVDVGTRWSLDGANVVAQVLESGRPARIDDYDGLTGEVAATCRRAGIGASVGSPIVVSASLWGVLVVSSLEPDGLPGGIEARLAEFTEIVANAIANREARRELQRLAAEQAALRRVATLVASGIGPEPVFQAVVDEVRALLDCDIAAIVRFEADGTVTLMGAHNTFQPSGMRLEPDPGYLIASVRATGRAARFDTDDPMAPGMPEAVRAEGIRAALASPIVVDGQLWGTMTVGTTGDDALPAEAEARLAQFAELMAMAVADTEAGTRADRLAEEQAALRRVATLVATEAPPQEVFSRVAEEVGRVLGDVETSLWRDEGDGTATVIAVDGDLAEVGTRLPTDGDGVIATVLRENRPFWMADNSSADGAIVEAGRQLGITSAIGCPIRVGGRVWGALGAARRGRERFAPGIESELEQFAELVATAIANAQARAEVERLADEQAALRRVATLVAKDAPPREVFAKVAEEVAALLGADATLWRDEGDGTVTVMAITDDAFSVGARLPADGDGVIATVLREGRPSSIRDYAIRDGAIVARVRERLQSGGAIGCPIVVGGRIWGAVAAGPVKAEEFPAGTDRRLAQFAELVATAIANAEAREALSRLADEQAALRRVATLVAQGASPASVFDAVAAEMAALLQADGGLTMCRYEEDGEVTIVAHRGAQEPQLQPGLQFRHDDARSVTATVRRTGQPARVDTYAETGGSIGDVIERLRFRSGVGVPIFVDGRVWGVTVANWMSEEPPPPDTEQRMAQFGELLDTAIANADSRDQLTASRARLLTTADEVRRRVVRDLHDGAQQRLVHGIVTLKLARRALERDDEEATSLVGEALEHVERGNAELRELARGILPAILTRRGLLAAIRTVVARLDLPVRVDVPDRRFPAEVEASAYFTVAEALTNVLKHAGASHAEVTASATDTALRIEVRDDGVGGADRDGNGLMGLQDRVAALGGRLTIESPVGGGTVLAATLPCEPG